MKNLAFILSALVITVASLTYALWGIDYQELYRLLASANYLALAPFLVALALFMGFNALRWVFLLRPLGRFSLPQVLPAMMIGFAGNNVLPAHLGELVRVVVFSRQYGTPASGVFVTQVVERILDVFAILMLYFVAVWMIDPFPENIRVGAELVAMVMGALCLVIIIFMRYPEPFLRLYDRLTGWMPQGLRKKGHALLQNAVTGLSSLKSPATLAIALAISLLRWASCGAMIWLALWAFDTPISLPVALIVNAVAALAVTVPTAPGFFGTMQAVFVFALAPFGISQEVALAASVFYLISQWFPVTLTGAAFFIATGFDAKEVAEAAEHVGEA